MRKALIAVRLIGISEEAICLFAHYAVPRLKRTLQCAAAAIHPSMPLRFRRVAAPQS